MKTATIPTNLIENINMYGPYKEIIKGQKMVIDTKSITLNNWDSHYNGILNILLDGIETDYVRHYFIGIQFTDGVYIELSLLDYFFNIIMWYLIIRTNKEICSHNIFFDRDITKDTIKSYIDNIIDVNRKIFSNRELNNIIDDTLEHFQAIDKFGLFLANTVNLEDDIKLMNALPEYRDLFHTDLSSAPIDEVKDIGMEKTNQVINIIKNHSKDILGHDHCLANAFRANQGVNPRQYKEFSVNIGSKPDGRGGVYPSIINTSYINGGVASPMDYFIESSTGRTAQILAKMNVGSSGHFARLLGLNNMDSYLNPDPNYSCDTKHLMMITIKDRKTLKMLDNRYYKLNKNGPEMLLKSKECEHLIGQTVYFRSPVTCASASRGHGICYKCYGDLAYTVKDINTGRIATEILSAILTQMLLSAKHLLETKMDKVKWCVKFDDFFEVEENVVKTLPDMEYKRYRIYIDPDSIELENEDEGGEEDDSNDDSEKLTNSYNEYIAEFDVEDTSTGELYTISNDQNKKLFISMDLNNVIRKMAEPVDGKICIDMDDIKDISLFLITLQNNELSRTLDHLKNLLNKSPTIKGLSKDELLQQIIDTVVTGGLNVSATHLETMLSNQIRSITNPLLPPSWEYENEQYELITLNTALSSNPSITISLSYQKIAKLLYNPLTYKKNGASFMDLFFMEKPQAFISGYDDGKKHVKVNEDGTIDPIIWEEQSIVSSGEVIHHEDEDDEKVLNSGIEEDDDE